MNIPIFTGNLPLMLGITTVVLVLIFLVWGHFRR
jgi:hypothetical protein